MTKRNLIAHHNKGTSDKVYMACIRDNGSGTFSVIGKWGRRGSISNLEVKVTTDSLVSAEVAQIRLFKTKLDKGYKDIEGTDYSGPVDRIQPWIVDHLEPETGVVTKKPRKPSGKPVPKVKPPKPTKPDLDDGVVVCIKNIGMDELFDIDTEYIAEEHKNPEMLWVYDKYGKKGEYFRDRFMNLSQYAKGKK